MKLGWSILYIEVSQVYNFLKKIVFFSLKINFVSANSADLDEHIMQHFISTLYAKVPVKGLQVFKWLTISLK